MPTELEARFLQIDPEVLRTKLVAAGFTRIYDRTRLTRRIYNISPTVGDERWLRIRNEADGKTMLTYKRLTDRNSLTGMEEVQVGVEDVEKMGALLACIGFSDYVVQENDRERWDRDGVEATIDFWPGLSPLVELEGPTQASVHAAAADLGFDMKDAEYGSIGGAYDKELGITSEEVLLVKHLTFERGPEELQQIKANRQS